MKLSNKESILKDKKLKKEDLIFINEAHDQRLSPSKVNTYRVISNHKTRLDYIEAKNIRPASKTGTAPSLDEDNIMKLINNQK